MTVDTLGRVLAVYRRTTTSRSAMLLIAANAIPVVGVVFFGWSLLTILVLYWLENGIVGFWNLFKINLARGSFVPTLPEMPEAAALAATRNPTHAAALRLAWEQARQQQAAVRAAASSGASPVTGRLMSVGRIGLSIFFLFHYGMFWFVHGIFVFTLPLFVGGADSFAGCEMPNPQAIADACAGSMGGVVWGNVAIAGVALFLSHGASFMFNYIGRGEYLTATPTGQMGAVYGRVVVLHLTIIFGSLVASLLGAPIGALLILVVLKTALDLGLHLRERRSADARIPADTTYGQIVRGDPATPPGPLTGQPPSP